ncbi:MAG TPA: SurA N-terminal domain-containing protein [Candidatus Methanoperedens sp.]|nr:SurA N-terminal domain-containing protein [Candidatus Methanoperedens sp.]
MKKIKEKLSTPPEVDTTCCQTTHKCCKFLPIVGIILVIAAVYAYYRFGVVATVNGKPISRFTYWQNLEKIDKKQTIKQMANEELVFQEAAKKGVVIEKSEIESEIASVEAQIKSQGQTLEGALIAEGLTRTDLEDQIRIQKLVEKMANPMLDITQAQIDAYLTENKALLPTTYSKEQLQTLAKTQLISEAKNDAIDVWFKELQKTAKIEIR